MAPQLLIAITAHGFGHLAQVAPLVHALRARHPEVCLRVRSNLPAALLRERLGEPLRVEPAEDDFGMAMHSPFAVDLPSSLARYRAFHADWEGRVARLAAELAADRPDLLLADVPYLTLAAAARAGVPAVALCSLHWGEVLRAYVDATTPEWARILGQIDAAYASARHFLMPAPSMPMPHLQNARPIAPLAAPGQGRRAALRERLALRPGARVVLVGFGGVAHRPAMEQWPDALFSGEWCWLVPDAWRIARPACHPFSATGMPFAELFASCDLALSKPGYGAFVEAAALGLPLVYVQRGDWPEQPALIEWFARHGRGVAITPEALAAGALGGALAQAVALPPKPGVVLEGAEQALDLLEGLW